MFYLHVAYLVTHGFTFAARGRITASQLIWGATITSARACAPLWPRRPAETRASSWPTAIGCRLLKQHS